jgi:hypothetical protein
LKVVKIIKDLKTCLTAQLAGSGILLNYLRLRVIVCIQIEQPQIPRSYAMVLGLIKRIGTFKILSVYRPSADTDISSPLTPVHTKVGKKNDICLLLQGAD